MAPKIDNEPMSCQDALDVLEDILYSDNVSDLNDWESNFIDSMYRVAGTDNTDLNGNQAEKVREIYLKITGEVCDV